MARKPRKKKLKITSATIRPADPGTATETAEDAPAQHGIAVDIDNPNDTPLHVWASPRGYDFNSETRVLTLYLTDNQPDPPADIKMISSHPRTPSQLVVDANGKATIDVQVPKTIRRRVAGEGLSLSFVEEPIEQIDRIDIHIQSAFEPMQYVVDESPEDHHKRLRAHGDVVKTTITPTQKQE